jgi:hypothetical protein
MKRFRPLVLLLIICSFVWQTGFATLPLQQVANDKASLAKQLETLMRKSSLWNSSQGRVELIVRVLADGRLEVLDIDSEQSMAVMAVRVLLAVSRVEADASLTGKAFHFVLEGEEAIS